MPSWRAVVTLNHPALGGIGTNTWHVRSASTVIGDVLEAQQVMEMIRQFYDDTSSVFATGTSIQWDGSFQGVGPNEGNFAQVAGWTAPPGDGGDPLPPATSLVVGWVGASGDRSRRGRTFLGPVGITALQDNGTPDEGVLTIARDAAALLVTTSEGFNDGAVGVWSRQESLFRDFVGSAVRNVFGSLRSRRD